MWQCLGNPIQQITFRISVKDVKSLKGEVGQKGFIQSNIRLIAMVATTLKLNNQLHRKLTAATLNLNHRSRCKLSSTTLNLNHRSRHKLKTQNQFFFEMLIVHRKNFCVAWYWNLRFLFPSTYRSTTHGVQESSALFKKYTRYFLTTLLIKWKQLQ